MIITIPFTDSCQKLFEAYGPRPQAIEYNGWLSVMPPNRAKFYHSYYAKEGAPTLVTSGLELAYYPHMEAIKLAQVLHDRKKNYLEKFLAPIFEPDEPRKQSS